MILFKIQNHINKAQLKCFKIGFVIKEYFLQINLLENNWIDSSYYKFKNKIKKATKGSLAKTDWVTIDEYQLYKGASRVKDILKELNKNKPIKDENINILAVSLRVVMELAIYDKLKNKGFITKLENSWIPSLVLKWYWFLSS